MIYTHRGDNLIYFRRILHLLTLILIFGCVEKAPVDSLEYEEVKKPSGPSSNVDREPSGDLILSDGEKLWNKNCASCHTNGANNRPTKLLSTSLEIKNAISDIKAMSYLSELTSNEIDYISDFLSVEAIKRIQQEKIDSPVKSTHIRGTRSFVISKLIALYAGSNQSIIDKIKVINNYPSSFGGTCPSLHEGCEGDVRENFLADMNAESNTIRRGIMIKVCQQLHDDDQALAHVLSYSQVSDVELPSLVDLKRVLDAFIPGHTSIHQKLTDDMMSVFNQSKKVGMSSKQAWSQVHYLLCSSPLFEMI